MHSRWDRADVQRLAQCNGQRMKSICDSWGPSADGRVLTWVIRASVGTSKPVFVTHSCSEAAVDRTCSPRWFREPKPYPP